MINLSDSSLYSHSFGDTILYADGGAGHDAKVSYAANHGFDSSRREADLLSKSYLKANDIFGLPKIIVHYSGVYETDAAYGVCTASDNNGLIHSPFQRSGDIYLEFAGTIRSKSHSYIVPYKETAFYDSLVPNTDICIDPLDIPFGIFWDQGWKISFDNAEDLVKYRLSK